MLQKKQESIPVECIPPACQPYLFWWPPGVGTSRGIGIREIPTPLGYLLPTGIPALPGYLPSLVTYPPWLPTPGILNPSRRGPGTRDTYPFLWTDTHLWKHYLPATIIAGGNYQLFKSFVVTIEIQKSYMTNLCCAVEGNCVLTHKISNIFRQVWLCSYWRGT